MDGVTASTSELNILDGVTASTSELNIMDGVTATATELNIMDGVTASTSELNLLDGVTATTTELNYLDITTLGTSQASKAVTASAAGKVTLAGELQLNDNINFGAVNTDTSKFGSSSDAMVHSFDTAASAVTVALPAEAAGVVRYVRNGGTSGGNPLTINNDGGTPVVALPQGGSCMLYSDGTNWFIF